MSDAPLPPDPPVPSPRAPQPPASCARRAALCSALILSGVALSPSPAWAQCATCGNPAFVSGGKDIGASIGAGDRPPWELRSTLVWGTGSADTYYQNAKDIGNLDAFELSMHVVSLLASVRAPAGTALSAVLPWGRLASDRRFHDPVVDAGLGDLELRLRQELLRPLGLARGRVPELSFSLGFAAPTGEYIQRDDALASKKKEVTADPTCLTCGDFCPDHCQSAPVEQKPQGGSDASTDRYLNLGRGVWWLLADLDVAGQLSGRVGYCGGFSYRTALGRAPDGFGWGAEQRWSLGLNGVILPRWVTVQLLAEYERREMSTDGTDESWVWFDNGGGHFVNLSPTVQSTPVPGLSVAATLRWPVYRDVIGTQVVQNPSLWISVSGTLGFGAPEDHGAGAGHGGHPGDEATRRTALLASPGVGRGGEPPGNPEIRALLASGKATIVDYWAEWCAPCLKLAKELEAFEGEGRPDVAVVRVDATDWKEADWVRFLPDAPTLPVIDVYDRRGRLVARLSGEPAFGFRDLLPEAPKPAATGAERPPSGSGTALGARPSGGPRPYGPP